jgi:hypothetical protein
VNSIIIYLGNEFSLSHPIVSYLSKNGYSWLKILNRVSFSHMIKTSSIILFKFNTVVFILKSIGIIKCPVIYFAWENEVVETLNQSFMIKILSKIVDRIYIMNSNIVDDERIHYFENPIDISRIIELNQSVDNSVDRKLLCQISGNKFSLNNKQLYSLRRKINSELISNVDYKFFGTGWTFRNPNYMGIANDKFDVYKEYSFSIILENARTNGGITEKIFDSFAAGCIPIYAGSNDILLKVPSDIYVNYDAFNNTHDLIRYLGSYDMDKLVKTRERIRDYLSSESIKNFDLSRLALHIDDSIRVKSAHQFWFYRVMISIKFLINYLLIFIVKKVSNLVIKSLYMRLSK